jgi:hypothetical protein
MVSETITTRPRIIVIIVILVVRVVKARSQWGRVCQCHLLLQGLCLLCLRQ